MARRAAGHLPKRRLADDAVMMLLLTTRIPHRIDTSSDATREVAMAYNEARVPTTTDWHCRT